MPTLRLYASKTPLLSIAHPTPLKPPFLSIAHPKPLKPPFLRGAGGIIPWRCGTLNF